MYDVLTSNNVVNDLHKHRKEALVMYAMKLSISDEISRFSDEKKRQIVAQTDEDAWRESIRCQMEQDLERRVREALETPPPPPVIPATLGQLVGTDMTSQGALVPCPRGCSSSNCRHREIQQLEQLNAHVKRDLIEREQEYVKNQRWRVLQAKRRMAEMMTEAKMGQERRIETATNKYLEDLYLGQSGDGNSECQEAEGADSTWGSGYKNQNHYARVSQKAVSNFGGLSDIERREFYYAFTRRGFLESVRTGKLPDGSQMESVGRKYRDKHGIIRDQHGPFWPHDYGPLHPTPVLKRGLEKTPEDFYKYGEESCKRTIENQTTPYTHKWRGVQILYDSEKSGKEPNLPPVPEGVAPHLLFESRFECGNLRQARRVGQFEYELVLKTDLYTKRHTQWFYFRVKNALPGITYKFRIVNLLKRDSLYNHGMRPLLYTEKTAKKGVGWVRAGHHINYTRNILHLQCPLLNREMAYFMLEWQMEFPQGDDTCYLAHCYPYTYSDLKDDLDNLVADPERSKVMTREVMCETRAGNSCFLLTVTNFDKDIRNKKAIIVTARVHPGETNSSWMMRGVLDYITGSSNAAKELRDHFVFKVVPMLNPDGVIVGNYRCSLAGRDLNRNYRHPRKESFPTIWHTKHMLEDMLRWNDVTVYCDLHGHSRKQNVFMYGCNWSGGRIDGAQSAEAFLQERLFPWLMSQQAPDKFNFNGCKFQVKRCKESTGRVVMFRQMKIENSFTMEATFCGSTICTGKKRHFNTQDLQDMGRAFCDVVLEYHRTQLDKTRMSSTILDLTRAITQQILEARGQLPPNLPCLATQLGREKLKEMVEMGEVRQVDPTKPLASTPEKVAQSFVNLIEEHAVPADAASTDRDPTPDDAMSTGSGDTSDDSLKMRVKGQIEDNMTKAAVNKMIDKISEKTIGGCVKILEQLHVAESVLESDSSDSDSESEPEMKWVEPRPRRKKKKKKKYKKDRESAASKKQGETREVEPPAHPSGLSDSGLPAIRSAERERKKPDKVSHSAHEAHSIRRRKEQGRSQSLPCTVEGQSMGKYVKNYVKTYPVFVNKYDKRSNGGIPCFSEERLLQRATKNKQSCWMLMESIQKMQEMKKQMEVEKRQRDAMYYVGFDFENAQSALVLPSQLPGALPAQHCRGDQVIPHFQVHLELRQQFHNALNGSTLRTGYIHAPDSDSYSKLTRPGSTNQVVDLSSNSSDSSDDDEESQPRRQSFASITSSFNPMTSSTLPHPHSHLYSVPVKFSSGNFLASRHATSATTDSLSRGTSNLMVQPITKADSDHVVVSSTFKQLPKPRPYSREKSDGGEDKGQKRDDQGEKKGKAQPPLLSREYTDLLLDKLRMHKNSPFNRSHPLLAQSRPPQPEKSALTSHNALP